MIPLRDTVPHRNPPFVTVGIIVVNALVFWCELHLSPAQLERLFYLFGFVPLRLTHPEWAQYVGIDIDWYWPLLTSMFLHGGWVHFLGNMWTLWLFGDNVEDRLGHLRFLIFYLLCGVVAALGHAYVYPDSTVPTIGASGAIAGVMGAYFLLFPNAQIVVLWPVFFYPLFFELPAVVYLGIWILTQVWHGSLALALPESFSGVAFWAHVAGFVAGMVLLPIFCKRRHTYRPWQPDESIYRHPRTFFWR